jgi:hypothetical protein
VAIDVEDVFFRGPGEAEDVESVGDGGVFPGAFTKDGVEVHDAAFALVFSLVPKLAELGSALFPASPLPPLKPRPE